MRRQRGGRIVKKEETGGNRGGNKRKQRRKQRRKQGI